MLRDRYSVQRWLGQISLLLRKGSHVSIRNTYILSKFVLNSSGRPNHERCHQKIKNLNLINLRQPMVFKQVGCLICQMICYSFEIIYLLSAKNVAKIFSRNAVSPDINISLNGDHISWGTNYKYLGVYLDSKLQQASLICNVLSKSTQVRGPSNLYWLILTVCQS